MASATSATPTAVEVRLAAQIEHQDEHPVIKVDEAIARGVSLADLGLSYERLCAARLSFVQDAMSTFLLDDSDERLTARALAYLEVGAVDLKKVSVRAADRETLQVYLDEKDWDDPDSRSELEIVEKAFKDSQPE
ncbi:MAG TPA: hypothetical protein VIF43_00180 [Patescibacteria group bacterium]